MCSVRWKPQTSMLPSPPLRYSTVSMERVDCLDRSAVSRAFSTSVGAEDVPAAGRLSWGHRCGEHHSTQHDLRWSSSRPLALPMRSSSLRPWRYLPPSYHRRGSARAGMRQDGVVTDPSDVATSETPTASTDGDGFAPPGEEPTVRSCRRPPTAVPPRPAPPHLAPDAGSPDVQPTVAMPWGTPIAGPACRRPPGQRSSHWFVPSCPGLRTGGARDRGARAGT